MRRLSGLDPGVGGRIVADVEGLTINRTGTLTGTLLVSSRGDNTFYTYDRLTHRPLNRFAIVDGAVDGTQDPTAPPPTPGLLVVQDGDNTPVVTGDVGEARPNTSLEFLDADVLTRRPRA